MRGTQYKALSSFGFKLIHDGVDFGDVGCKKLLRDCKS